MSEVAAKKTAITLLGSLRKDSINEPLRRHMSNKLREAGVEVTDLDLRDFPMPIFNQDIEDAGETPAAAKTLADMFRSYDIVLLITPEYNGGITPLVANLISWTSRQKPNPFKHATTVPFRINEAAQVRIDILDVRGRIVREFTEQAAAGEHHVVWDGLDDAGRSLAPGAYYVKMSVNGRPVNAGSKAVRLR